MRSMSAFWLPLEKGLLGLKRRFYKTAKDMLWLFWVEHTNLGLLLKQADSKQILN